MRIVTFLAVLLCLALFGCSEETPLDVPITDSPGEAPDLASRDATMPSGIEPPLDRLARGPRPEVPFHAVEENTIVNVPPFPCLPPDFPDLCDEFNPILHSEFPGVIRGTHIGNATILGFAESNLITGEQTARGVITAANGDKLTYEGLVVGVIDPEGNVVFDGVGWFTPEGTGRFANASGEVTISGTANLNDLVGQYVMDGYISYGPPDPRNVRSD